MSAVSLKMVSSIIKRREWEPLFLKARKTVSFYHSAANVGSAILDHTGRMLPESICGSVCPFQELCAQWHHEEAVLSGQRRNAKAGNSRECPCTAVSTEYLVRAQENGGTFIFTCKAGLIHWISPLYRNGQRYGALIAGKVLGITRNEAAENISAMSKGGLSAGEAMKLFHSIPEKTHDEVKALARMLLVCAEQVSKYAFLPMNDSLGGVPREKAGASREYPRTDTPSYPFDKEKMLLASLRRGDIETGRRLLNDLVRDFFSGPENFTALQHRSIELLTLLSRAAMSASATDNGDILAANDRCLRYIQEAKGHEDLSEVLRYSLERIGGKIFSFRGLRHASALRKAERFIWENYTRKISLREIAGASGLSAPYFSTIFKEEMGENLSVYLNHMRVNRAAAMLAETRLSLIGIAGACGFEDLSWFSKIFKLYTGTSPGKFREQGKSEGPLDDRQKIRFGA
ncbi:MAG: helix-turn-helix domain-containing protein [Spirochaetaceae bacterium]|jgi:AraC-like DNA-binding protein/ligand-binding sensor protein|nr:helix-turn-helix domain-containing protein [Spirochaetaceae bacterium]